MGEGLVKQDALLMDAMPVDHPNFWGGVLEDDLGGSHVIFDSCHYQTLDLTLTD